MLLPKLNKKVFWHWHQLVLATVLIIVLVHLATDLHGNLISFFYVTMTLSIMTWRMTLSDMTLSTIILMYDGILKNYTYHYNIPNNYGHEPLSITKLNAWFVMKGVIILRVFILSLISCVFNTECCVAFATPKCIKSCNKFKQLQTFWKLAGLNNQCLLYI